MLKIKVKKYFDAFENKDLGELNTLFSKNIYLNDWENEAKGIQNVLLIYDGIFKLFQKIKINLVNVYIQGDTIIAELHININDHQLLKVVDIIEFSHLGKIKAIRAYKG
jgi:hypothetical protein